MVDRDSDIKKKALIDLYEKRYGKIAQYIFIRVGNQHDAEDLASEAFIKALKALDSYEERGWTMEAWVFKIARNLLIDHYRKTGNRQTVELDEMQFVGSQSPEEKVEKGMQIEQLEDALAYLSPVHREIIALRFFSGLSAIECAEIIGKTPGNVRAMQCAAMKTLRKIMGVDDGNE